MMEQRWACIPQGITKWGGCAPLLRSCPPAPPTDIASLILTGLATQLEAVGPVTCSLLFGSV